MCRHRRRCDVLYMLLCWTERSSVILGYKYVQWDVLLCIVHTWLQWESVWQTQTTTHSTFKQLTSRLSPFLWRWMWKLRVLLKLHVFTHQLCWSRGNVRPIHKDSDLIDRRTLRVSLWIVAWSRLRNGCMILFLFSVLTDLVSCAVVWSSTPTSQLQDIWNSLFFLSDSLIKSTTDNKSYLLSVSRQLSSLQLYVWDTGDGWLLCLHWSHN